MTERRTLTLTDPRAIRVLAHEVRQQLMDELSGGEVLTATEAAKRCGITPSAMSYHLRAMERWGIVERVESADGRERPWRMAAESIRISDESSTGIPANVANSLLGNFIKRVTRTVTEMVERNDPDDHATISQTSGIHLTDEEAEQLDTLVSKALARFDDRHDPHTAPPGSHKRAIYWLNLPRP
ncbi:transcriptional regulator [Flexivirga endophytica]|uniref:Transcriptional regulator n=1 Tax=Flexivirga endophytica TaxID=1849103 RepID=A0A916T4M6_9MICO|nr:helix-turn-helix domain-containing protein [Flexivirga endophytica]GGB29290.1 transcriptional regulator [Flexivirga endophytica]GHB50376.1 transcriptional regulator [Flexivirga endophytica]